MINPYKPTAAFIGASWAAVSLGIGAYLVGLWNADMLLSEKRVLPDTTTLCAVFGYFLAEECT